MSQYPIHTTTQWLSFKEVSTLTGLSYTTITQRLYHAPAQALRRSQSVGHGAALQVSKSYAFDYFAVEIEANKISSTAPIGSIPTLSADFLHFIEWYRTSLRKQQANIQEQIDELYGLVVRLKGEVGQLVGELNDLQNTLRTDNNRNRLLEHIEAKENSILQLNQRISRLQDINHQQGDVERVMLNLLNKIAPHIPHLSLDKNLSLQERQQIIVDLYNRLFNSTLSNSARSKS